MNVVPYHASNYSAFDRRVSPEQPFAPFQSTYRHGSIIMRFEEQAARHPGRIAIYTQTMKFSYDELNSAANQIARIVADHVSENEKAVGLFMDQSALIIAGILGILKAGKFYVPLNSAFSSKQNNSIVEDSKVGFVLADNNNLTLCEHLEVEVLNLERYRLDGPSSNLDRHIPADSIAYTLYTSGSTGRPKPVAHTHRNVLHNIMNYTNGLHINADDRLTLLSATSFGASVSDIFGALLNGAALYPFDLKKQGLQYLSSLMREKEITIYHSVPSVYRNFVSVLGSSDTFPKLRMIKLGGETVTSKDVELYKKHFTRNCLLHVGLGSTEVNVIRQLFLDHDSEVVGSVVPVGYEVPGTEVLIVDQSGLVVGPGSPGEIAIRSEYLPLGKGSTYLTGDLGLMQPDGCLVHLGRKDFQIKIRGYRIEVAEIELALKEFPGIQEAAVSVLELPNGEKSLVAYVVASQEIGIAQVRRFLHERIAEYMIPSQYIFLDALPFTANGKIDRLALPRLSRDFSPEVKDDSTGSPTEEKLAAIWKELLSLDRLGYNDNFFELGGDSLMSLILVARISNAFQVNLAGNSLYQHPTISSMSEMIDLVRKEGGPTKPRYRTLVPLTTNISSNPPIFIVPGGRGDGRAGVVSDNFVNRFGPDLTVYALMPKSVDGKTPGHASVTTMASDYIDEIRKVQAAGPYFIVGSCIGGPVAFEMARQLERSGETVALLAIIDGRYTTRARWFARSLYNFRTSLYVRQFPRHLGNRLRLAGRALRRVSWRNKIGCLLRVGQTLCEEIECTFHSNTPTLVFTKRQRFQLQYRRTIRQYRPGPYGGQLALILSDEFANTPVIKEWRRVVRGVIEVEFVPGQHADIQTTCAHKTATLIDHFYRQALAKYGAGTAIQRCADVDAAVPMTSGR